MTGIRAPVGGHAATALSETGLADVRSQFPGPAREHAGRPFVYLDGPGGTQVPRRTIEAMQPTWSGRTPITRQPSHERRERRDPSPRFTQRRRLHRGGDPAEIVFGQNMTTLTYAVSRAIDGRQAWRRGSCDSVDHDATWRRG